MPESPKAAPKKQVNLTVRTGSKSFTGDYNVENKVEKVRQDAAPRFNMTLDNLSEYDIYLEAAGKPRVQMQPSKKLEDYSVKTGDVIVFEPRVSPLG